MNQLVSLEPLEEYSDAGSIDLRQARTMLRGRDGNASLEVVRRWANPERGCRPIGPEGPVVVLPAIKIGGEWRTMPSWVQRFERERERLGRGAARNRAAAGERTPARAAAGHRRAKEYLEKEGVGVKRNGRPGRARAGI